MGGALAPGIRGLAGRALAAARESAAAHGRAGRGRADRSARTTVGHCSPGSCTASPGQVDGLVRRPRDARWFRRSVAVIATGGLAPLVIRNSETVTRHEPDLTLLGLRLVFERNVDTWLCMQIPLPRRRNLHTNHGDGRPSGCPSWSTVRLQRGPGGRDLRGSAPSGSGDRISRFRWVLSPDHYLGIMGDGSPGPTDAWVTLAGLARETNRIRLGTLVSPTTFRLPGPLAIMVAEVDAHERRSGGTSGWGPGGMHRNTARTGSRFRTCTLGTTGSASKSRSSTGCGGRRWASGSPSRVRTTAGRLAGSAQAGAVTATA